MLNEFKSKLENGEFVYGVFVKTSDPMFNEIIGISGYDYVILDTEHGPTDIENQQNNIRACELRGILPIVRVPYIDDNVIGKALDIGAMGIQISQIRCAEDVKKVIKYAKFYPEGERGVCRFVRAADYSSLNRNAFFKKENEKIIIIQLEGKEAIDNLDEEIKSVLAEEFVTSDGHVYTPIATIRIPKINIYYPILSETTEELLKKAPTKFMYGEPNEVGNFCIAGHNYRNKK